MTLNLCLSKYELLVDTRYKRLKESKQAEKRGLYFFKDLPVKGTFFWVGKIFKTKFPKNTTFMIISLNFWNNQWNSRKNLFIVWLVYIHETVKLGVKIEKNGHLCFFSLKTNFCDLKLKLPFQPFLDSRKN